MKQLLILSGKGGTGKTTTAAAFIRFSEAKAIADCDVDAPNLHIVTNTKEEPENSVFYGSEKAYIDPEKCIGCGKCDYYCRFGAIRKQQNKYSIVDYACEGCGVCELVCPQNAVSMKPDEAGSMSLFKEEKVFSTAKLKMGRGNSGKLVTEVKRAMNRSAENTELAIIDGSPGIGCPVIASVSGVDMVLIVAEPSMSGLSDLKRILQTASILQTKAVVSVNKYDIDPEKTHEIEELCKNENIPFVGKVPYDRSASKAINEGISIADIDCPAREALYQVYLNTINILNEHKK